MWQLAWRQLQLDVVRTTLTATALAAVVAVLLVLQGFELGLYHQLNRTALDLDTELIALQPGVTNLLGARSSLPQLARAAVEAVDGVADAWPLTGIPVIYQQDNQKTPIYVFVYDIKGGPAHLATGHAVEQSRDIVIDRSLAQKYQLHVGDRFTIADFDFQIAGITTGHAALFMPFAYIGYDGMLDLFLESQLAPDLSTFPLLSFLLLDLDKGASAAQVAHRVEQQVPEVDVLSSAQLGHNSVALGRAMFGPVLGLLLSVAYVIGFLVVTLIMDADVRARRRNLVVLMALGFSATRLAGGGTAAVPAAVARRLSRRPAYCLGTGASD
ncbi:MAG: ABC transporter permease [Hahellaceae bacterium]|nr:ABC transporter permease [Hahellaceae bacterium]MCP5168374.1 ABC transporter permease [Hahellaceae bacterium]